MDNQANQNNPSNPPLTTPNTDPSLEQYVEQIEKDLLTEIMNNIQANQLTEQQAQTLAQEFLKILPIADKQELLNKLKILSQESTEVKHIYNKYLPIFEEEKRTAILNQMRDHIQNGNFDQAIDVAKTHYAGK